ncbi:adenylyltransferase/cytidyltransferase family protein [Methanoregula sp.]|uniref:adenylyltransferase/cytidyltransferase family protein n=1 Tax=Methanoregula sp. TaxID=2052170 RepID=UPI002CFC76FF|nr:adenylyltransferase/cytidyltransferase family protein [Methanoregula sp.]HVP96523.1 adenylyltransferase/cytidyltransferase family protein [Methanoregula sp.]
MTSRRVVATGTFDILHPGHLYYLAESKKLGDELWVIVARDANVKHKPHPIVPEDQRLAMVAALRPVDHAILGDHTDMFRPIQEIHPDIITIGFNQYFDEEKLRGQLAERGLSPQVVRIGKYADGDLASSRLIVQRIVEARGDGDQRTG